LGLAVDRQISANLVNKKKQKQKKAKKRRRKEVFSSFVCVFIPSCLARFLVLV
jgi:hypothetical protein